MFDRPYRPASVHDLKALAQARWHDRPLLEALARELAQRADASAPLLLGSIRARLRDLPSDEGEAGRLAQQLEEERHRARRAQEEVRTLRDRLASERAAHASQEELADLRRQLEEERWRRLQAAEEATRLRQRLGATRAPGACAAAYSELFLTPDVPDDLLETLQRAYRKHYHPDRAGSGDAARFQAMQQAFEAIRLARGLS